MLELYIFVFLLNIFFIAPIMAIGIIGFILDILQKIFQASCFIVCTCANDKIVFLVSIEKISILCYFIGVSAKYTVGLITNKRFLKS